jgi:hypothetical protein
VVEQGAAGRARWREDDGGDRVHGRLNATKARRPRAR